MIKEFWWDSWLNIEIKDTTFVIKYDSAIMYEHKQCLKNKLLTKEEVLELLIIKFIENSESSPDKNNYRKIEIG